MILEAVLFDLHNTLVYLRNPLTSEEVSEFLLRHGYEVYPQSWDAASHFVGMVDYPRKGYSNRRAFMKQILHRIGILIDSQTLQELASLYDQRNVYKMFPDAAPAVLKAKQLGMKTAIVTTIPDFDFNSAIEPIKDHFDVIMTGYRAGCEKSNPLMYKKALRQLDAIPNRAVVIGDELLVDVKIPKKLGTHIILLDRRNTMKSKPHEADDKAATLTEAMNIVQKWQKT
jgi:HAD superfamily hydrolase (TIGR01549 family)